MGTSSCVTKCTLQLEHNVGGGSINVVREDIVKLHVPSLMEGLSYEKNGIKGRASQNRSSIRLWAWGLDMSFILLCECCWTSNPEHTR